MFLNSVPLSFTQTQSLSDFNKCTVKVGSVYIVNVDSVQSLYIQFIVVLPCAIIHRPYSTCVCRCTVCDHELLYSVFFFFLLPISLVVSGEQQQLGGLIKLTLMLMSFLQIKCAFNTSVNWRGCPVCPAPLPAVNLLHTLTWATSTIAAPPHLKSLGELFCNGPL